MNTKKVLLNTLPLLLIGTAMVYAAAPSGGYLPGATSDPDCAPGDTDCFVQVPVNTDDQTLSLSGTALGIEDGNSVDLSSLTSDGKFVDGTDASDAVYTTGKVGIGTTSPRAELDISGGMSFAVASPLKSNGVGYLTDTQIFDYTNDSGTYKINHYGMTVTSLPSSAATYISGHGELGLFAGSANRLHIKKDGNVGIGTDSPTQKLDVNGNAAAIKLLAGDGTAAGPSIAFRGDTGVNTGLYLPAQNEIGVSVNGVERMRIQSDGKVGIGTDSPEAKIHAVGNLGSVGLQLETESTGGVNVPAVRFKDGDGSMSAIRQHQGDLVFGTGWFSERMRIQSDGKVGIGTTSPSVKLEIIEDSGNGSVLLLKNKKSSTNITNQHNAIIRLENTDPTPGNHSLIAFRGANSTMQGSIGMRYGDHSGNFQGDIFIEPLVTSVPKSFIVKADTGNVGIGTASPSANLEVSSDTNGDSVLKIVADTDNSNEGDNPRIKLLQDGDDSSITIGMDEGAGFGANTFGIHRRYAGIDHLDGISMNMSNGNVGIGTTSPDTLLDVAGTLKVADGGEACDATTEGAIKYDTTVNKHQGCDGTTWNNLY